MKRLDGVGRRWLLLALAVLLLAGGAMVVLRAGPMAPVKVTVAQVERGRLAPALFGIGTVEARRAYLIGPTVAGRVLNVAADVGEAVAPGQVLAEMDPVDLDERLTATDAALARAASLVAASQAQRADAQARRQLAAANARRYQDLAQQKFVSPSVAEARVQEQASADAALAAAEAALSAARQEASRLQAERAALAQQRRSLRLLAPAAGLVTTREAEPGSTVVAGQAVLRLADPASLWVRLRLDQGRSNGLAAGLPAEVVLRSRPGQALSGRVLRLEPVGDSVTEERIAQVGFEALPPGLTLGELCEVTVRLPAGGEVALIPNAALRQHGGRAGVWRRGADGLQFVPLRLGQSSLDGRVEVLEGLAAGDEVVVHSEREITADSRIRVVDAIAGRQP